METTSASLLSKSPSRNQLEDEYELEYFPPRHLPPSRERRPNPLSRMLCVLTGIGLFAAIAAFVFSQGHKLINIRPAAAPILGAVPNSQPEEAWRAQVAQWVNGDPTAHLQSLSLHRIRSNNLRNDTQYVTTWIAAGWTNDFMTYINMIYLGVLTSRIPIIPPFAPSHIDYDGGFPPFGDIFDVSHLAAAINTPLLEWRDVKCENSTEFDELGCWSIWGLVGPTDNHSPRGSKIPGELRFDISYTMIPKSSEIIKGLWIPFWTLAKLGFSSLRTAALAEKPPQNPAPRSKKIIPPDERLLCFDFMYYVGAQDSDEWWREWSPAWVGKYARWSLRIERLSLAFIQRALGAEENDEVPLYIAVHVRRGDFTAACGHAPAHECFAPLAAYARRVGDVSATLFTQRNLRVPERNVLVTSDETDTAWWEEVAALGWRRIDHAAEETEARYGKWYVMLVDAVAQSLGVGFVGTDRSTMSLVAKRRVEDWNGGYGELVRIGSKHADDH